jgi:hypothetical protein
MADDVAGEGQQMTQQSTIDRSVGGAVTLLKAAAMVTVDARARAWWRQGRAVGHHPVIVVDDSGKDVITTTAIDRHCS